MFTPRRVANIPDSDAQHDRFSPPGDKTGRLRFGHGVRPCHVPSIIDFSIAFTIDLSIGDVLDDMLGNQFLDDTSHRGLRRLPVRSAEALDEGNRQGGEVRVTARFVKEVEHGRTGLGQPDHPVAGTVRYLSLPATFSSMPRPMYRRAAPTLGQHNAEVLGALCGLREAELERLAAQDVIGTRPKGL